jgi:hypothetical protein
VGGRCAKRFLWRNWPHAFSLAELAWPERTDGQTDVFAFFCFFWIFFVEFFSPSLKLTKMKKQNKK